MLKFQRAEHRRRLRPARLAAAVLVPLALLWAAGTALPGLRGDIAGLAPAQAGVLPHAAPGTAVRLLQGVVMVASTGGRFYPAVPDGARVARMDAVGRIQGLAAPGLLQAAAAASATLAAGGATRAERRLLTARAVAAAALAAAHTAPVVAPAPGTLRWRLPPAANSLLPHPGPPAGQWVTAGQPLGVVAPPTTEWAVRVAAASLPAGTRVRLTPPGVSGRVTRAAAGTADVAAGPTAAGADGRPVAVTVAWGRVAGVLLPSAAVVRQGGAAWVLAATRFSSPLRWVRVSVLAADGARSVVAGLPAGSWVAARPWLAGLWAVWQ